MEARSNNSSNSYAIKKSSLDDSAVLIVAEANFTSTELAALFYSDASAESGNAISADRDM